MEYYYLRSVKVVGVGPKKGGEEEEVVVINNIIPRIILIQRADESVT